MIRQLWTAFFVMHYVLLVLSFGMMLVWWRNKTARLLFMGQAGQSAAFSFLPFLIGAETIRNSAAVLAVVTSGAGVALVAVSVVALITVGLKRNGGIH